MLARMLILLSLLLSPVGAVAAAPLTIAAASSLRPALDAIIADYRRQPGSERVDVVYGSTGKLTTQIRHGAPFALLLAADLQHPQWLVDAGIASPPVRTFARGRLAIWTLEAPAASLQALADPRWHRIAIANPRHAPYGQQAREALHGAGVLAAVESRLVSGENVGQAAQLVASGAADAGIVALSLRHGDAARTGHWLPIDPTLHRPLAHGIVLTRLGADDARAMALFDYLLSPPAQARFAAAGFSAVAE